MKLAVIGGDGIGPEVVAEGLKVLDAVAPGVEKTTYDLGARRFRATGELLPDSVLAELQEHDAILLGAVGDPSVPSGVLERGLLLRLRFELDHHVNLRPGRLYPGVSSPLAGNPDIDFVVVRVVHYAFERALQRRKHLTLVHKTNVLNFSGKLWSRIVAQVGEEYPDV